jgi:DNA polymerase III subunit delta
MSTTMVQGADPSLRDREVQRLIDELLAGEDRSFALDDHTLASRRRVGDPVDAEPDDETRASEGSTELPAFAALTTALQSPPFMTSARVVVVRDIANATTEQAQWLAGWIADPLDGVHLVLVAGGGRVSSALDKAIKANATVVGPAADQTADLLQRELHDAHLKLAPDAAKQVAAHLGDDAGRVPELVELLHSTYGDDATLSLDEVERYLGEVGTAGRFDLTNFIDRGDVGSALETLHRMLTSSSAAQPKPLHPMQIMASLVFH